MPRGDGSMLNSMRRSLQRGETGATHPALPAVVLLVCFAVFMAAIAPLDFTSFFRRFISHPVQKVPHQNATVWVDTAGGVYYCANSILFGKTSGQTMTQVAALDRGYQPALGTYCTGPDWPKTQHPSPAATSHASAPHSTPL